MNGSSNGFAFPAFPPDLPPTGPADSEIIILGAGLSGLCAGLVLARGGYDVTILEARERPGGRVETIREGLTPGLYADVGAAFVPGFHTYTVGYVREAGLDLKPVEDLDSTAVDYLRGTLVGDPGAPNATWPVPLSTAERKTTPNEWFKKYLGEGFGAVLDTTPRAEGWPGAGLDGLADKSLAALLAARGASQGAVDILRLGYADLWGDGVDTYSSLVLLRDMAFIQSGLATRKVGPAAQGPRAAHQLRHPRSDPADSTSKPKQSRFDPAASYRIPGGTHQLPDWFARELGPRVRYRSPVVRIERDDASVRVYCEGHDGPFVGQRVICTLPFPVLQRVEVDPPFRIEKQRAIRGLPHTSVTRTFLEFETRYWEKDGRTGLASTDLPGPGVGIPGLWIENATPLAEPTAGLLDCYIVGPWARWLEPQPVEARVAWALEQVEKVFPGARSAFSGRGVSKSWGADPWAIGGYCWFRPGEIAGIMPHLASPDGRVHFAGDHTSVLPGWMQGALESGVRVAHEVAGAG
ncbi:MAG: NAD(P)/FAD-dependent oxidoreductase [Gemmatimonadota bacterium]|nr:NAD(P)/FAD-dependent oxidoreductase [Gemmatimonadota bacterium]